MSREIDADQIGSLLDLRMTRRRFGGMSLTIAAGLGLIGCGVGNTVNTKLRDTLNIAYSRLGNQVLDPTQAVGDSLSYQMLIFDSLVGLDRTASKISKETGLAEDWTVSPDGRTYTFRIRQGVKFHNGDDVTADDVNFTLQSYLASPISGTWRAIVADYAVNGPNEFVLHLRQGTPGFPDYFYSPLAGSGPFLITPKKYIGSVGRDAFGEKPIGSGPYKFVSREVGAFVKLAQASPRHFAIGAPRFKQVDLRLVLEESTRLAMLQSGEADAADISYLSVPRLKAAGLREFPRQRLDPLILVFQLQRPGEATLDMNIRKAISFAINREELSKFVLNGTGVPFGRPLVIAPANGFDPAPDPFDLARAKQFLDQTAYGSGTGKTLTLQLPIVPLPGWPMTVLAQALQSNWAKIGIQTVITQSDQATFYKLWNSQKLPAPAIFPLKFGASPYYLNGMNFIGRTGQPFTTVADHTLDALLDTWNAAADNSSYFQASTAVDRYLHDQYYAIPVVSIHTSVAGNNQLPANFSAGSLGEVFNERGMVWT